MTNIWGSLRRHVFEYYLFYVLAYGLVLPIWLKLAVMFSSKNIDESFSLLFFIMGGLLIPVAGGLKHYRPKLKIIDRALLAAGLLIEVVFLVKLFKPALSHVAVALPLSISLAVSTWWTVVYFLDLSNLDKGRNYLIGKEVLKYFILCALLLYVPSMMLGKYYRHQVDAILAAGSVNVAGGLDSKQIEKMIDEKMWQARGLLSILIIFILILLFYFYRRVKNRIEGNLSYSRA